MERLPSSGEVERDLRRAADAVASAQKLRRQLRRRTKRRDPERQNQIRRELRCLDEHGGVLRSHKKRSDWNRLRPYTPTHRRAFTRLLRLLRLERQKLVRMIPRDELT